MMQRTASSGFNRGLRFFSAAVGHATAGGRQSYHAAGPCQGLGRAAEVLSHTGARGRPNV